MIRFALRLIPLVLCLSALSPAGTILWDSFTITIDQSTGTPTSAIVDVVNLHWTGISPVPTSAQLQDLDYATTLYNFTGVQQAADGTVVPNEQAFITFDPTIAAEILNDYPGENIYIGLYTGSTFIQGQHAHPANSTLDIITPEPQLVWPTGLALGLLFVMGRRIHTARKLLQH